MRTCWIRYGTLLAVLLVCWGCTGNSNLNNPFVANTGGGPFASGPFAGAPAITPSVQVRELEKWQRNAAGEYQRMQSQVAAVTRRNESLEAQITNAQRHAQLQDQHLADVITIARFLTNKDWKRHSIRSRVHVPSMDWIADEGGFARQTANYCAGLNELYAVVGDDLLSKE